MRFLTRALAFVVVIAAVLGLGWLIVRGISEEPGIVGSFATALSAVLAVVAERAYSRQQDLKATHREQLLPLYEQFVELIGKGDIENDPKAAAFLLELQRKIFLRAPTPVIEAWVAWVRSIPDEHSEGEIHMPSLLAWERLFRTIRKDLGHDDTSLPPGDLLRVLVGDLDQYLPGHASGHA